MGEISEGAISGAPEAAGPEAAAIVERGSQRYKETKFFGDRDNGIGTTYFAPPKGEAKFHCAKKSIIHSLVGLGSTLGELLTLSHTSCDKL